MPHPNLLHGYHEIKVTESKRKKKPEYDYFIGRFKTDKKYHLLGYRPIGGSAYFSAESESRQDLGIVTLPDKKSSLSDLAKGDALTIMPSENTQDHYKVYYHSS